MELCVDMIISAGIKHYFYIGSLMPSPFKLIASLILGICEFPESKDVVNVRYGISYIGVEQAKRNL